MSIRRRQLRPSRVTRPVETLYHATYLRNLDGIARHGLKVRAAGGSLLRAVPGNVRGIYLSEWRGVPFWFGKLRDWANYDSDNPVEDRLLPIVLRVTTACDTIEDPHGMRDAYARAVVCRRPIVPGAIQFWNGNRWVRLSSVAGPGVDPAPGADWKDDEDMDEGGFWSLRGPYGERKSGFMPEEP